MKGDQVWVVIEYCGDEGPRLSAIHATKEGAENAARKREQESDPDDGYSYSAEGPWVVSR